ncbi:signal recognition particle protein [Candidatus Woesearchaeota archaeon]|nr:signal recognition particle protein [Candidatus Woesearchaeota archaeon]
MVLDSLSKGLKTALEKVAKALIVDQSVIDELVRELQRVLIKADVNVKLVFELSKTIKQRALKEKPPQGVTKKEHLINIVYEELVKLLGSDFEELKLRSKPSFIMLVGLFGSGKTTTAAKLGLYYSKRGFKCLLLGADTHRLAACEQLKQLGLKVKLPVICLKGKGKALAQEFLKIKPELEKYDIVIIDTAGRDALSSELIEEINLLSKSVNPDEVLLVLSADIGQAAEKQARAFHEACHVTGIIVSKLDGTAKAGGALAACNVTKAKIKFIGVGEKPEDLEVFKPKNFVSRLLGMGDLEALLEKVKHNVDQEKAEKLGKKVLQGDFTLVDLYEQMLAMQKMGPLSKIMNLIPGLGGLNIPKEVIEQQQAKLERWRYAMDSMTKQELENPEIIKASRVERIAKGSGVSASEVRQMLKQYMQTKKLLKQFKSEKDVQKALKRLQQQGLRF